MNKISNDYVCDSCHITTWEIVKRDAVVHCPQCNKPMRIKFNVPHIRPPKNVLFSKNEPLYANAGKHGKKRIKELWHEINKHKKNAR